MSYLAPWSAPQRRSRGAGRAMSGLGDTVVATRDPVATLAAQVSRFGAEAPAAYQFSQAPFLDSGNLSPGLALVALTIYQRRAADAYAKFGDATSQALLESANQGFSSPVTFVMMHLADVTQSIRGFGDSVGLPAAAGDTTAGSSLLDIGMNPLFLVVAGVAIWWVVRR